MIATGIAILSLAAIVAPWLYRLTREWTGAVLAVLPLAFGCWLLTLLPGVLADGPVRETVGWLFASSELGTAEGVTFLVDGLGLTFAVLISFIGSMVLLYTTRYMRGHPFAARFYAYLTGFLVSMLGLVLSDNIIVMFVFWELTSITSYLLIGFDHQREKARKAALQALLTTGIGGLLMLAGLVILGLHAGSFELSAITQESFTRADQGYWLGLVCILMGCFTKSAQFPFHYWLPNAMEGPSPVSALLHSSTMVKAGVYLLARLNPAMGSDPAWTPVLVLFGGGTMLLAAFLASRETYLKKVLAYTTVSSLGILVMLIGLSAVPGGSDVGPAAAHQVSADAGHAGASVVLVAEVPAGEGASDQPSHAGDTQAGGTSEAHTGADGHGDDHGLHVAQYAAAGMMAYLIAHALFKAALFLGAGAITKVTGEKDTARLGGLFGVMPVTAICMAVSAASMAGLPPLLGFGAKEALLHGALASASGGRALLGYGFVLPATLLAALLTVYASVQVGFRPFFMPSSLPAGESTAKQPREPDWPLLVGVVLLSSCTVVFATVPALLPAPLIEAGVASLTGRAALSHPHVAWYAPVLHFGWKTAVGLAISVVAVGGGVLLYTRLRAGYGRVVGLSRRADPWGQDAWYDAVFGGVVWFADRLTRLVQNGRLVSYVRVVVLLVLLLGTASLARSVNMAELLSTVRLPLPHDFPVETILGSLVVLTVVAVALAQTRLATVAMLGVIGYSIAVLFVQYGAADVAMTQFATETLTVIIFVLVLFHMRRFRVYSRPLIRGVDLVCALLFGVMITMYTLVSSSASPAAPLGEWHAAHSSPLGNGRNIVNVILVDFRGMDTLGEILVLGIAAFGVLTLLKLRSGAAGPVLTPPGDPGRTDRPQAEEVGAAGVGGAMEGER